jgi:hypothetical protein
MHRKGRETIARDEATSIRLMCYVYGEACASCQVLGGRHILGGSLTLPSPLPFQIEKSSHKKKVSILTPDSARPPPIVWLARQSISLAKWWALIKDKQTIYQHNPKCNAKHGICRRPFEYSFCIWDHLSCKLWSNTLGVYWGRRLGFIRVFHIPSNQQPLCTVPILKVLRTT